MILKEIKKGFKEGWKEGMEQDNFKRCGKFCQAKKNIKEGFKEVGKDEPYNCSPEELDKLWKYYNEQYK